MIYWELASCVSEDSLWRIEEVSNISLRMLISIFFPTHRLLIARIKTWGGTQYLLRRLKGNRAGELHSTKEEMGCSRKLMSSPYFVMWIWLSLFSLLMGKWLTLPIAGGNIFLVHVYAFTCAAHFWLRHLMDAVMLKTLF